MKGTPSEYMPVKAETQNAVLDWVRATEEFHFHYIRIGQVLNGLCHDAHPGSAAAVSTNYSHSVKNLFRLRKHMSDVLETLLFDMSKPKQPSYARGGSTSSSKAGQLTAHTQLLREINQSACEALSKISTSYA